MPQASSPTSPQLSIDFPRLACELVRALRGKRSQGALNRKLGFASNQVSRWETGTRAIGWDEFVMLCRVCHADIDGALQRVLFMKEGEFAAHELLVRFMDQMHASEFAHHLGVSRHVVGRWLSGKVVPETSEMLRAIASFPRNLFEFLSRLVDPSQFESTASEYRRYTLSKGLEIAHPEIGAVLRCLELADYRSLPAHQEGFVAKKLGLSIQQERTLMSLLRESGAIEPHNEKLRPVSKNTDTRCEFDSAKRLRQYWIGAASRHLDGLVAPTAGEAFGYLIFAVSENSKKDIMQKYIDFYNAVRHAVTTENPEANEVMALCVQLFSPRHLGAPEIR